VVLKALNQSRRYKSRNKVIIPCISSLVRRGILVLVRRGILVVPFLFYTNAKLSLVRGGTQLSVSICVPFGKLFKKRQEEESP